ncbi:hypothetical protein HQ586_08315 [Candidatus Bathyarchaeota archaeon]|nr:hypothetical protein [Candidatus Bathyarchaeota archaeon]
MDLEKLSQRVNELESQLDLVKDENEQLRTTWGMALEALKIELGRWTSVFSKEELLERLGEEDFISEAFKLPWNLDTKKYNEKILSQEAVCARAHRERASNL